MPPVCPGASIAMILCQLLRSCGPEGATSSAAVWLLAASRDVDFQIVMAKDVTSRGFRLGLGRVGQGREYPGFMPRLKDCSHH